MIEVVKHGNWIPFAVKKDVQDVEDVRGVGYDNFGACFGTEGWGKGGW